MYLRLRKQRLMETAPGVVAAFGTVEFGDSISPLVPTWCPSPLGAHRALCKTWAILDPFSLMAKVTAVTTVFPDTQLLRFLLSLKTQTMSQNKVCLPLKMPDYCLNLLFVPRGRSFPGGGVVCRVVTGKVNHYWVLCPRCRSPPPPCLRCGLSNTRIDVLICDLNDLGVDLSMWATNALGLCAFAFGLLPLLQFPSPPRMLQRPPTARPLCPWRFSDFALVCAGGTPPVPPDL